MPQFIKIGSTNHFNLRSAIRAALNGQGIDTDTGFYDILSSGTFLTATLNPIQLRKLNAFARFGAKTFTFSGSGSGNVPRAIPSSPATPGSAPLKATEAPAFLSGAQSIAYACPMARRSMATRPEMEAATSSSRESRSTPAACGQHQQDRYRLSR
jgi:hypothetical protein